MRGILTTLLIAVATLPAPAATDRAADLARDASACEAMLACPEGCTTSRVPEFQACRSAPEWHDDLREPLLDLLAKADEPTMTALTRLLTPRVGPDDTTRLTAMLRAGVPVHRLLAATGSDEALHALIDYYVEDPNEHFDVMNVVVEAFGPERRRPIAMAWLRAAPHATPDEQQAIGYLLSHAHGVAETDDYDAQLMALLRNRDAPMAQRRVAYFALSGDGHDSEFLSAMRGILSEPPSELREWAAAALVMAHSTEALSALIEDLATKPESAMTLIGDLGPAARSAGPDIAAQLDASDSRLRAQALETLRRIEYVDVAALSRVAHGPDPVLAGVAALQLRASIEVSAASEALDDVAKTHWFPVTREIAAGRYNRVMNGPDRCRNGTPVAQTRGEQLDCIIVSYERASMIPACTQGRGPSKSVDLPIDTPDADAIARAQHAAEQHPERRIVDAVDLGDGWLIGVFTQPRLLGQSADERYAWLEHNGVPVDTSYLPKWIAGSFHYGEHHYLVADPGSASLSGSAALIEVRMTAEGPQFRAQMHLPAWPQRVLTDGQSRLVLESERSGSVDLSDPMQPRWMDCVGRRTAGNEEPGLRTSSSDDPDQCAPSPFRGVPFPRSAYVPGRVYHICATLPRSPSRDSHEHHHYPPAGRTQGPHCQGGGCGRHHLAQLHTRGHRREGRAGRAARRVPCAGRPALCAVPGNRREHPVGGCACLAEEATRRQARETARCQETGPLKWRGSGWRPA